MTTFVFQNFKHCTHYNGLKKEKLHIMTTNRTGNGLKTDQ